ncbi:MAG: tetratricopeptide repeat protein [Flavobacteriales bacterium]
MAREDQDTGPFDAQQAYNRTEAFIENNKKRIIGVVVLIVAAVGGYFGYQKFYIAPMEEKAGKEMWKAEYYFGTDSLQKAIKGDQAGYKGFKDIVEEYGGTKSAELAHYYLAVSYLRSDQPKKAVQHATEVDTKNEILSALAKGIAGEAYVEMGKHEEGVSYFKAAANRSENGLTRPLYLKKAGIVLESIQQPQKALELYERIRDEHPGSRQGQDIEKYIGRAEAHI